MSTRSILRNFLLTISLFVSFSITGSNYYWVGGSGNWSDYNGHWATQSGGQVYWNHVPTPQDTVIFDTLSFLSLHDTVYANTNSIYCHTMKWMHNDSLPFFYSDVPKGKLRIYGSLLLDSTLQWNYIGQVIFCSSDPGNTITSGGITFPYLQFKGDTNASWMLNDTLRAGRLIFRSGDFYSAGHAIITGIYEQDYNNTSRQFLDTSAISCALFRNRVNPALFDADSTTFTVTGDSLQANGLHFGKVILPGITGITGSSLFEHIVFSGNSIIAGSNTYGFFESDEYGIVLMFAPGTTQLIRDSIRFNGSCKGMSALMCWDVSSTSTFDFQCAAPVLDQAFIENIDATGNGATINSGVLQNGSGWTQTTQATPRTLYWVGGTNAWSDTSFWSSTSGGTSGECAPTPIDNVIFDNNSFFSSQENCYGDLDVTFCNDMDWAGTAAAMPGYTQPNGALFVYGSLNIPSPLSAFSTSLCFRSDQPNTTVNVAGTAVQHMAFDGIGSWNLQSPLICSDLLFLHGGFSSGGNTIAASYIRVLSNAAINMGGSNVTCSAWLKVSAPVPFIAPVNLGTSWLVDYSSQAYNNVTAASDLKLMSSSTFNTVTVNGGASISGNNQFDSLLFTGSDMRIVLAAGSNQTITGDLQINASCTSPAALESSYSGGTTYISKTSGVINCDYLIMQDVHAIGGATFNATNTCATYNVSGWNVTPPPSAPLYWIGGSGNWNDPNHWSLTSGGSPWICIPNPLTDVYFDANSFSSAQQTVNISSAYAYCRSMDWTSAAGNPNLVSSASNELLCYGSLTLEQDVSTSGVDLTLRSHVGGNTITTQQAVMGAIVLDGIAGDWSLTDSLQCDSIHLINGAFYTNGNVLTTLTLRSDTTCARELHLDSSMVFTHEWLIAQDSAMILDATAATISADGERFSGGTDRHYHAIVLNEAITLTSGDTIDKLTILGSCSLQATLHIDTLLLYAAGNMISLNGGDTLYVDSAFVSGGNQSEFIGLESADATAQTYITKTTDTVCLEFMILRGIDANGGATFYAGEYSTNVDYNSGWLWQNCNPGFLNVWPGDANYDLVADNFDILAIGIAYGETGGQRPNASLAWIAQPNSTWSREFADSTDIVHADCNGDGIIGQIDTLAVSVNYGLNHPARFGPPEEVQSAGAEIKVVITQAAYQPGDTVEIPIWVGTQNAPVNNGYGIAFSLNWDHPFIEPGTMTFDYSNSWFAPATNNIHLEKQFLNNQQCDFGISRISHSDTSGGGELVMMRFVLTQNANGPLKFWFTEFKMIDHNEDTLSLTSVGGTINAAVGIEEPILAEGNVFPNPATDAITISTSMQGNGTVSIYDATGRMVQEENIQDARHATINVSALTEGSYIVCVKADHAMVMMRMQKIK